MQQPVIVTATASDGSVRKVTAIGARDLTPEPSFDDIVALAAAFCEAPAAFLSLADRDPRWFKASAELAECESEIDRLFCRFGAAGEQLLVIPDLYADPRTRSDPLVTAPHRIRFLAALPLTTQEGRVLGTLGVVDQDARPNGITPAQAAAMQALARQTVEVIALWRRLAEREAALSAAAVQTVAQEASREALELRWTQIFHSLREGFLLGTVIRDDMGRIIDWRYEQVNLAWSELTGVSPADAIGRTKRELFPNAEEDWIADCAPVVDCGERLRFTRQLGPLRRWYDGLVEQAGADHFVVLFTEVTERVEAVARQDALLEIGDLLRDCTSVADTTYSAARIVGRTLGVSRAGYGTVDAQVETVEIEPDWTSQGVASIAGRHRFDDFGQISAELRSGAALVIDDVRTDPRTASNPAPMLALAIGSLVNMPVRERGRLVGVFIVQAASARVWKQPELAFIRNVADRLEVSITRLRAEARQQIVNGEIAHRLKNSLAMVQGIAAQTLRGAIAKETLHAFNQRLVALGKAHDALMQSNWTKADLGELIADALAQAAGGSRWTAAGPAMKLGDRATVSTSLLLHELATNAIKHGSLSVDEGSVAVHWEIIGAGNDQELVLIWREIDGPPAAEPTQTGFGSRLLKRGLLGTGGATLCYDHSGLVATFREARIQIEQA